MYVMTKKIINRNFQLTPSFKMFVVDNFYPGCVMCIAALLSGTREPLVSSVSIIAALAIFLKLLYSLWYYTTVKWTVTDTQLVVRSGIFMHTVNYLELYRVVDFTEEQTFLQQLFHIKDVVIMSTDRSHPVLRVYGIHTDVELISYIKPLVTKCRKENYIYEIANH